jgi:hypothetical protein
LSIRTRFEDAKAKDKRNDHANDASGRRPPPGDYVNGRSIPARSARPSTCPIRTAASPPPTAGLSARPAAVRHDRARRPAAPAKGDEYHDTTVGFVIKFDGKVWRNPHSGASV